MPGRHRYITVTGWEPLGNLCRTAYASSEATPYGSIEPQAGGTGVWYGTWGKHYFTMANLIQRSIARWCMFSEDWGSFDYMQFMGGTIKIPQTATCPWMITFDEYLNTKLGTYNPKEAEDKWGHPGILLNVPKTHLIFPPSIYRHQRMYKIRVKPPPGWKGVHRFPEAFSYVCVHWLWSWWDPTHAFFNVNDPSHGQDVCPQAPWWAGNRTLDTWVNRQTYKQCQSSTTTDSDTWGPFLPCRYGAQQPECSLFFFYKLRFKVIGNAIWRPLPRNYAAEGLVPDPKPAPTSEASQSSARESHRKRARPQSTADIWPGDLDSSGLLTERAFKRITADSPRAKRRELGHGERLRLISEKLRHILRRKRLLRQ